MLKIQFKKSRWRTAAILKNVICDISAAIRPILIKFGMMMHLCSPNLMGNQKFKNPWWQTAAILKIEKSRYLVNRLADCDEILHDGTYLSSEAYQLFKKSNF